MGARVRIAIIGDYRPDHETHPATTAALEHAARALGLSVDAKWISTTDHAILSSIGGYDGVWIAPGSPYRSLDGALGAITQSRSHGLPLLGTCAGFQHIVIEFARNVLGDSAAAHAEYDSSADCLFITPLSCSLAGNTFAVSVIAGTRAYAAYGTDSATERYYCNFGLNPNRELSLVGAGLVISGRDHTGEARIIELADHPFFVGTLFVPQMASSPRAPHPLVQEFIRASSAAEARASDRFKVSP